MGISNGEAAAICWLGELCVVPLFRQLRNFLRSAHGDGEVVFGWEAEQRIAEGEVEEELLEQRVDVAHVARVHKAGAPHSGTLVSRCGRWGVGKGVNKLWGANKLGEAGSAEEGARGDGEAEEKLCVDLRCLTEVSQELKRELARVGVLALWERDRKRAKREHGGGGGGR
jgi:hypothetical protein